MTKCPICKSEISIETECSCEDTILYYGYCSNPKCIFHHLYSSDVESELQVALDWKDLYIALLTFDKKFIKPRNLPVIMEWIKNAPQEEIDSEEKSQW